MNTLEIYTSLKNSDLTCMSAKEAIVNLLGFTQLESLQQFKHWTLEYEADPKCPIETIKQVIQGCYQIINPNKDHVFFDKLPRKQTDQYICHIQEKYQSDFPKLIRTCHQRGLACVKQIRFETIWTFKVQAGVTADDLLKSVIITKSFEQGLLVNPLTQNYRLESLNG